MNRARDDERLSPEDTAWTERIRKTFRPEPLDATRASAFDAQLQERLERRTRRPWAWAALATASATALAWAALPGAPSPVELRGAPDAATLAWEQEVIFGEELSDPLSVEDGDLLPDDYLALANAFDF